ncbi:tyrosine-type recombinase/integrase [Vreelandella subterranea]|uniref:tyrosine-type recombinase/integrase n=1 Tax=Vreelandella subterranea TaxID=416874 RepID=UPI001FE1D7D9|nr:tyrosine-type recombinase/integrase [Halomonas subterranea]
MERSPIPPFRVGKRRSRYLRGYQERAQPVGTLADDLYQRLKAHGPEVGRLFPSDAYQAFTNAIKNTDINLPKGQRTHVLRHTFASHFIMNGGNLLTLQKILGHQSIQMTMRYSHLAPDHLKETITFGPKIFG